MLSWPPLVHVGAISYGLYLWNLLPGQTFHLIYGRHAGTVETVWLAAVMIAVVELSYRCVERPVLRWAKRRLAGATTPASRERTRRVSGAARTRPVSAAERARPVSGAQAAARG